MRVEREVKVDASVERAFAEIADWTAHATWQPTLVEAEAPQGVGAGARLVEHRSGFGQHIIFDLEVVEFEPPHRIRVHARSRSRISLAADEEFLVEPGGDGGSVVRMALEFDLPLVLKPLAHGVAVEVGKQLEESLAALGARLGTGAASRPAGH